MQHITPYLMHDLRTRSWGVVRWRLGVPLGFSVSDPTIVLRAFSVMRVLRHRILTEFWSLCSKRVSSISGTVERDGNQAD